ncbi:MAG: TIGR03619 family F420-dependent LLM class oxidoreductase [Alphaproteobacteria bacterium]|nr:TIGR03619 family F420-dependent LLM class oxidoreductase [Alphaproteobacteria bacterium]
MPRAARRGIVAVRQNMMNRWGDRMEFGFNLPNGGPLARPDTLSLIAARGEQLGFGIFAIPDHIIFPTADIHSRYPYTLDGKYVAGQNEGGDVLEPLAMLAYLAGVTKKARLLLSVLVVPYRHPVLTAKLLSTADLLSNGRVVCGIGVGWMEQEFAPVGAPPFAERGKVTDEYVAIYRELWTNPEPRYKGQYCNVEGIVFSPRPVQKGGIPIWVGGETEPAMRRTARYADGWYPICSNPKHPLDTLPKFKAGIEKVRRYAEEAGRNPDNIKIASWVVWPPGDHREKLPSGDPKLFTGRADDMAADIDAFTKLGVTSLMFRFMRADLPQTLDAMTWFAEEVMPKVKAR